MLIRQNRSAILASTGYSHTNRIYHTYHSNHIYQVDPTYHMYTSTTTVAAIALLRATERLLQALQSKSTRMVLFEMAKFYGTFFPQG
jgi:hypothetical protein